MLKKIWNFKAFDSKVFSTCSLTLKVTNLLYMSISNTIAEMPYRTICVILVKIVTFSIFFSILNWQLWKNEATNKLLYIFNVFYNPESYIFAITELFKINSRGAVANNTCNFGQNCHFFDFFQFWTGNCEKMKQPINFSIFLTCSTTQKVTFLP